MELHPAGFIETGNCTNCDGPRYIRGQPNRSSTENEGQDGILTEWSIDLPYRNLLAYTKEIQHQWPKLDPKQRDIIANSLSLFVMNNPDALLGLGPNIGSDSSDTHSDIINKLTSLEKKYFSEHFENSGISLGDISNYIKEDKNRTSGVLDEVISVSPTESEKWLYVHKWGQMTSGKIFVVLVLLFVFLLIGVAIGRC